jgi:hypothetical protein
MLYELGKTMYELSLYNYSTVHTAIITLHTAMHWLQKISVATLQHKYKA